MVRLTARSFRVASTKQVYVWGSSGGITYGLSFRLFALAAMPSDLLDEVNITRFTKAQGEEIRTFLLSDFHKTEPLNATLEVPPQDVLEFYKSKFRSSLSRSPQVPHVQQK